MAPRAEPANELDDGIRAARPPAIGDEVQHDERPRLLHAAGRSVGAAAQELAVELEQPADRGRVGEALLDERARRLRPADGRRRVGEDARDARGERRGGPALGEEARDPVGHDFRHASDVARDHRHAGGEGLQQRLGHALRAGRRQDEAVHHGEERRHVVAEAREHHVLRETRLAREPLHPAPADAVAHEQERGCRMDGAHRGKCLEQMRVTLRSAEHRDAADHG